MPRSKSSVFSDPEARQLIARVLRENFHLYRKRYAVAFVLMAVAAIGTLMSVFLMKDVTRVVFAAPGEVPAFEAPSVFGISFEWFSDLVQQQLAGLSPGLGLVAAVAFAIVVVFAAKGLATYGSSVILSRIGNNIVSSQQQRLGEHVIRQPLAFFSRFPSGDLIARTSYAANGAREVMNLLMMRVQDLFTAIALISGMFRLDWRLTLIALFVMSPVIGFMSQIIRRAKKVAQAQFHGSIQVVSALQESILGTKLIKAYSLEEAMRDRLAGAIVHVEGRANKLAAVTARSSPVMEFTGGIAVAAIVFYGGYRNLVLGGEANTLIAFLTALLLAYEPVKRITKMNVNLQSALAGVRMLYEVVDTDHSLPLPENPAPVVRPSGTFEIRDVTFGYRPSSPVLHRLSLTCPAGKVTALVGPSGSGKSTILHLLERFYAPDTGRILLDGLDLADADPASLRRNLALVSQDTFLFSDTIRNNIRLARPDASDAEIEAAAKAAFAHDFILEQPDGYETHVGENGTALSGGQRQRISIARAFLKNAPILLLDEATSALDSESEQKIQAAFDELMKGRTTIVIAHRFSTIRNAELIHVLREGRLVASGTHDQLISDTDSLYHHLYKLQHPANPSP